MIERQDGQGEHLLLESLDLHTLPHFLVQFQSESIFHSLDSGSSGAHHHHPDRSPVYQIQTQHREDHLEIIVARLVI